MKSNESNEKILKNAACLTFSDILLSGDADVRLINKKPQVYIYKNTTISGIMESLYILDNLGVDTESLTFDKSMFNFEEGIDFTEPALQVCIDIYNEDYKIDKSKIYDYEEKDVDFFTTFTYSSYSKEPEEDTKIVPKIGTVDVTKNTEEIDEKTAEELLTVYFDNTKFKTMSSEQTKMCLVDYIKDDVESGEMMQYLSNKIESMIEEYDKLMSCNITEIDQYTDVHLKRMSLVEETRIASVVSLKNLADKAVTNLLEEVFNSFSRTLREQYDAVLRIMNLGDGY